MAANKKAKQKARITKVKVTEVKQLAPEVHEIATVLVVEGPAVLPTMVPAEEVTPPYNGDEPQVAATGHWYDFLKGLW
jgi:hypothetical protein